MPYGGQRRKNRYFASVLDVIGLIGINTDIDRQRNNKMAAAEQEVTSSVAMMTDDTALIELDSS
jgi:hypothetical protein